MKKTIVLCVSCLCVLAFIASNLTAATFTLSDSALMSLDYKYPNTAVTITSVTNVAGAGVRFNILYPNPLNNNGAALYFTSSIYGGNGSLAGIDISSYDSFALKFTLISAAGVSTTNAVGPIIVGSMINQAGSAYAYTPEVISNSATSAISATTTNVNQIGLVGFCCNIPYWWYSSSENPWDPTGATISLLIEAAPNATVIPEPATMLLLTLGGLLLRRKKH